MHRFTVREYHALGRAGVLAPGDRTELIAGRILHMAPIGSRHAWLVARLTRHFGQYLPAEWAVWSQSPLVLGARSEPEPDLMLLRPGASTRRLPRPADVVLVVEVSDATYRYDRDVKVPLYAKAEVPEVWLIVPEQQTVEVYHTPVDGAYTVTEEHLGEATVSPRTLPNVPPVVPAGLFDGL